MDFPGEIQFSQGSLQDFIDCPRRFQLRHVMHLRWPAEDTEPALENERHLRQGAALHRLIRQHLVGIPAEVLNRYVSDPELRSWWQNYLQFQPGGGPSRSYPEITLSTIVGVRRLTARYDLIVLNKDGMISIFDWKTYRRRPRRSWLARRMQTRVYPYVVLGAWDSLDVHGHPTAEDVKMVYWFAEFPDSPAEFCYSAEQQSEDTSYLVTLTDEIERRVLACPDGELMARTQDGDECRFCRYRSLCGRGVEAGRASHVGEIDSGDDLVDFRLDVDWVDELEVI